MYAKEDTFHTVELSAIEKMIIKICISLTFISTIAFAITAKFTIPNVPCTSNMAFAAPVLPVIQPYTLRMRLPRCIRPRFYASTANSLRGFRLLRADLHRLSRLARGDITVLLDRKFSLDRYDSAAITRHYDARPFSALFRVASVGLPFLVWLFSVRRLDRWRGLADNPETASFRADQLRKLLVWAGPTYLKVGQAVGNRPDLVGLIYSNELQKLVDNVGAFDGDKAVEIVRKELAISDLDQVFNFFEKSAIASASLGQVHRAQLRSGENVAVKVQRPTVEYDAALDVYVLKKMARFVKARLKLRSDLVGIVDEFATRLWEELDYVNEADYCERFDRLYAKDNEDIYVPKIYRQYTTKRVLCMEWIDGDKAPWFPKEDAQRLIRIGVQCSLQQLLDKGFVHADPHGGNLLRTKDGRLCYLDFGMCVQVDERTRYDLIVAIVRLINRDYNNMGSDFVKLGFLPPDVDTKPLAPLLAAAFGDASTGSALSDLSFSRLANNLSGLAYATPIRIPVFFTLIIRSLTILEGFALQTDASFKIVDESYPYVVQRVLTDDSPAFQQALKDVLLEPSSDRIRWSRLESLLKTRSSSVPDGAVNGARDGAKEDNSVLSGVSNRSLDRIVDFALSERGAFLRRALLLELTDVVDEVQLALAQGVSRATGGLLPAPNKEVDLELVENAIQLAKAVRIRAWDFLASSRWQDGKQGAQRRELLRRELLSASRSVAGGIVDRNSRRLLRGSMAIIFGQGRKQDE